MASAPSEVPPASASRHHADTAALGRNQEVPPNLATLRGMLAISAEVRGREKADVWLDAAFQRSRCFGP